MILYWIFYLCYIIFAYRDIKRAIIAWIPISLLFNPLVALWYSTPILAVTEAVELTLPVIFFIKGGFRSKKPKYNLEPFLFKTVFGLYFLSYFVSTVFSQYNTQATLLFSFKFFLASFLTVYMFQRCLATKEDLRFFVKTCMVVIVIIVGLGAIEFVTYGNPWADYVYEHAPMEREDMRARSFYRPGYLGNPNLRFGLKRCYSTFPLHLRFGAACVWLTILFAFLWKKRYEAIKFKNTGIICLLLVAGVVMSNSKGPMLAMAILSLAIFTPRQLINYRTIVGTVIVLCGIVTFAPDYINNFLSLSDESIAEEGGGSSIALRQVQMGVAIKFFERSPLIGLGPGSLRTLHNTAFGEDILGAESIMLSIPSEFGILGFVAFFSFYVVSYRMMSKVISHREAFFLLLAIGCFEFTNGRADMMFYSAMIIALRKYVLLSKLKNKPVSIIRRN